MYIAQRLDLERGRAIDTDCVRWDLAVLEALSEHRTHWADMLALGILGAGGTLSYVLASLFALLFAVVFRAWRAVGAALLASVAATALAEYAKEIIARPRPPAALAVVPAGGFAMPSSIAALTAGAATPLVIWGLRRAAVIGRLVVGFLAGGTMFVGVSMVYLGAHWLSDVLVGWALGTLVGVASFRLLHWIPSLARTSG